MILNLTEKKEKHNVNNKIDRKDKYDNGKTEGTKTLSLGVDRETQ